MTIFDNLIWWSGHSYTMTIGQSYIMTINPTLWGSGQSYIMTILCWDDLHCDDLTIFLMIFDEWGGNMANVPLFLYHFTTGLRGFNSHLHLRGIRWRFSSGAEKKSHSGKIGLMRAYRDVEMSDLKWYGPCTNPTNPQRPKVIRVKVVTTIRLYVNMSCWLSDLFRWPH